MTVDDAHVLYRMFDGDGALLYVGITLNPQSRFRHHRAMKKWWTEVATISLEHFESREALDAAERAAIRAEGPVWNVARFSGRQRRTPPMITLPALRRVGGWSVEDVCDLFEQKVGYRPIPLKIESFEARGDVEPEFIAHYEIALGLPPGLIVTDFEPLPRKATA